MPKITDERKELETEMFNLDYNYIQFKQEKFRKINNNFQNKLTNN